MQPRRAILKIFLLYMVMLWPCPLTFWTQNLKSSSMFQDVIAAKVRRKSIDAHRGSRGNNPQKWHFYHIWSRCDLDLCPFDPQPNQLISDPRSSNDKSLEKSISAHRIYRGNKITDGRTHGQKTWEHNAQLHHRPWTVCGGIKRHEILEIKWTKCRKSLVNKPELFIDARVAVINGKLEQRRCDGDVLGDGDSLLIWTEHRSVVISVGDAQFNISNVDVLHVRVLDVDRQIESRIQQRVIIHWLHSRTVSLQVLCRIIKK